MSVDVGQGGASGQVRERKCGSLDSRSERKNMQRRGPSAKYSRGSQRSINLLFFG